MSKTSRIIAAPGHYIIRDEQSGKVSYWQGEYHQSAADSSGVSTADYIHAMYFFLLQAQVKDVLMIGCGGGTLATMLQRSGVRVTVVDLHRFSFAIARKYFSLPQNVVCHVDDGIRWLKDHRHRFDAIVLDAFGKDGMPDVFKRATFFRLAKSRMTARGSLFLMNVIVDDDDDATPDRLVRLMRQHWSKVRLLDTDGWVDRNAVIAAGAVTQLKKPKVLMPPRPGGPKLARELAVLDSEKHPVSLKKKSFSLSGHRTSVALEAEFWAVLEEAAKDSSLAALVGRIDASRGSQPLASALRLYALARAQART